MENIVRKGEISWNKQVLLLAQCFLLHMALIFNFECTLETNCKCFLPYMALIFHFKCTLKCCLQFVSIWDQSIFLSSGDGLSFDNDHIPDYTNFSVKDHGHDHELKSQ